jgi:hypothetical protein
LEDQLWLAGIWQRGCVLQAEDWPVHESLVDLSTSNHYTSLIIKNDMNTSEMLDTQNDEQWQNEIFQTFDDNGDWEYTRLGMGEDHIGLYLVDLDDSGERFREKLYINDSFSAHDVIMEGLSLNVFEKYEKDDIRYNINDETATSWDTFLKRVAR